MGLDDILTFLYLYLYLYLYLFIFITRIHDNLLQPQEKQHSSPKLKEFYPQSLYNLSRSTEISISFYRIDQNKTYIFIYIYIYN
jgi:hypothetical protein